MAGVEGVDEEVAPERGSEGVDMAAAAESLATDVMAEAANKDMGASTSTRRGRGENKDNGADNIDRPKRNSGREIAAPANVTQQLER